ncbi:hypothetical protein NP233_g5338 [Leucocoprinus birnbaumii]|uniref:Uncharacterized protein n=1 Tax=Leucocoprinus birnbaumii TaxID=56174 RepID=A0AAD5VT24_9AGAR|nr:hypothetical protein NP233_g5338 [Leucocoprinus birnbaumii]
MPPQVTFQGNLVSATTRTNHLKRDQLALASAPMATNKSFPAEPDAAPPPPPNPVHQMLEADTTMGDRSLGAQDDFASQADFSTADMSSTYILVCMLATWMHLIGGISRATTTRILKFIEVIINTSVCTRRNSEHESQSALPLPKILGLYEIYVVQSVSITIRLTVSVNSAPGGRLLEAKNAENDSGQDVQLEAAQKLYHVDYIPHRTSSLGSSSSFPVQGLRT